jgi:hypothetical protein
VSRYPSAQWRPIRDTSTKPVTKDVLCWHTGVGGGLGIWSYFDRLDVGVYSHGIVCGIWGSDAGKNVDGLALQMADTDYRAAANLDGNWRVISWETGDNGERPIKPWTLAQCDTMVRIMVDAHRIDGIPLVLVPDSKPGRRGIAYHRQGCDPYRVAGGELWSSSYAKDCPTQARIDQIPNLITRARAIVAGNPEEDELSAEDVAAINKHTDAKFTEIYNLLGYGDQRVDTEADTHPENLQRIRQELTELRGDGAETARKVDLILQRLPVLPEPTPEPTA